jgi:hypothetical protein
MRSFPIWSEKSTVDRYHHVFERQTKKIERERKSQRKWKESCEECLPVTEMHDELTKSEKKTKNRGTQASKRSTVEEVEDDEERLER